MRAARAAPPDVRRTLVMMAALGAVIVAVYVLALDTGRGLTFDARAVRVPGLPEVRPGSPPALLHASFPWLAASASLGLLLLAVAAQALRSGGIPRVAAAGRVVAGAFLTAELLKWLLGQLVPLGGDTAHGTAASFPSVHAAVATTLGLLLAATAPPALRRGTLALACAFCTGVGVLALLEAWHYPSDVVAGNLLGAAWVLAGASGASDAARAWSVAAVGGAAAACALLAAGLIASAERFIPDWVIGSGLLAGSAAVAVSAAAAVLVAARATSR